MASPPGKLPVQPAGKFPAHVLKKSDDPAEQARLQAAADKMGESFRLRIQIADALSKIKHTFIVMSGKGGVGKSTVAVNLAASLAAEGAKVGLLDLDLTNPNDPRMLGVRDYKPRPHEDGRIRPAQIRDNFWMISTEFFLTVSGQAIIWRGPVKMNMIKQLLGSVAWGELDYLVIDLPPGTGDEPLSIAQLLKDADGVIVVTTPQQVSVDDVGKSLVFAKTMDLKVLGVVENMSGFVCPHCRHETHIFGAGGGARLAEEHGVPLLGQIPLDPALILAGDTGVPFVWGHPDSATAKAFAQVVEGVKARMKGAA